MAGDTPWSIRGNTLYFEATGKNSYIEDFIQTAAEFPLDNTRVEFEIRAAGGTRLGYIGPTAFWAGGAEERRDAHNVTASGRPILGVQAWYRWENKGTRGIWIHGVNRHGDHPQLLFSGLNQGSFARHVITIQDGKLTYESPDCPALTYELRTPLQPGATRRFSFGARLYDNGVKQTIEIRNLKITSLDKPDPKMGDKAREMLNREMAKLADEIRAQVRTGMDPLVQQVLARVQKAVDSLGPQVTSLLQPVMSQITTQIQTQAQAQMKAAQSMTTGVPKGGMPPGIPSGIPQVPGGMPPGIPQEIPQGIPPGMFPGGLPGMPQGVLRGAPGPDGGVLLAQAGPAQGPSADQIMLLIMEHIRSQIKSEVQNQSQIQAQMVQPQVEAVVQSVIGPLMPEIEQMAQAHAQTMASALNSYVDANLEDMIKVIMPLMKPDTKAPASEMESLIRQRIEDELKPQITAAIEDEVQTIVQDRIIAPIQSKVAEMIKAQLAGARSRVAETVDKLMTEQLSALPGGFDIKSLILESVDSVEACIMSDVETKFKTSGPQKFLISVTVNGKTVSYDVLPVVKDGCTLVPLRAIAQSMGAEVQWNDQSKTITLSRGDKTINLGVGDTTASVNNTQVSLDVPATIVNGRTLVPARFISESLGGEVKWDQSSKTASIVTKQ